MMTAEKIRNLISQGEVRNTNVEFKTCKNEVGQSVYESICAFLNRHGGEILMGVDYSGNIVGLNEKSIDNHIKNIISTLNNIEIFNNQEGYILAVALLFGKEQTVLNYCPWHRTDAICR